ncbi:unnamed protein product [Ectocarpus fasciculatus]
MSTATASETGECSGGSDPTRSGTGRAGSRGADGGGGDHKSDSSFDDHEEDEKGGGGGGEVKNYHDDHQDERKEGGEEGKVTETDGEEEEEDDDDDDEEEIRRVRVAQSLAMYRSQLAAERRLEEANLHCAQEEKAPGACVWSPPGSPPRYRGDGGITGGFQRRLEEASAEVSAEAAASPQIVTATTTSGPRGSPAENTQTQRDRGEQVTFPGATEGSGKCDPGGGDSGGWGRGRQWTAPNDRVLARLVRECEFDFDLVAARFSSAVASGDDGEEKTITAEECRVRFARFDREEEDNAGDGMGGGGEGYNHDLVPDLAATPAPGVIENAGLSFADLERKARNMKSRFLEPPKDLPSTRDADDRLDDDDDAEDDDADARDLTTNKKKTTTGTSRSSDDADGCGAGKDHAIREDGAQIVATKEPVLLVINDPGPASNADHGGRGNFESNCSGDSGSDGEDDEVLTRAQIKGMAKRTHRS